MQNFLIAIVVVVVLGGGYLLWQNSSQPAVVTPTPTPTTPTPTPPTPTPAPAPTPSPTPTPAPVTVTYTDAGFSPSSVTVKKGQAVRFVNNSSSQEVWPASAVHPTHSVYPVKTALDCLGSSFDACKGLKTGESWSFTFNSVGEWRYHDHLHASKTGTVIVTE